MLVVAALPKHLQSRLRAGIAADRYQVVPANTWRESVKLVLAQPVELAILDPQLQGLAQVHEIERFRTLFPSIPIVLYTKFEPQMAPVLLRLGQANVTSVILAWHDDHPGQIRNVLEAESARSVSNLLLEELNDLLAQFPRKLRWGLETAIRKPSEIESVQQFADMANINRRTCSRWFSQVELPPPHVVLRVLRVTYAHRLLQDPGYTIEDVAGKLGYTRTKSFTQAVKEVFGMAPRAVRASLSNERALEMARDYLGIKDRVAS